MTDKILLVRYVVVDGVEYATFKVNKEPIGLVNRTGEWKSVNVPEDYSVFVRCKDDMIAIINSEKKMRYLLGA